MEAGRCIYYYSIHCNKITQPLGARRFFVKLKISTLLTFWKNIQPEKVVYRGATKVEDKNSFYIWEKRTEMQIDIWTDKVDYKRASLLKRKGHNIHHLSKKPL